MKVQCPNCQKDVMWDDEHPDKPFCSERCRLIDLGEWASENHRIAGEPASMNDITPHDDEFTQH